MDIFVPDGLVSYAVLLGFPVLCATVVLVVVLHTLAFEMLQCSRDCRQLLARWSVVLFPPGHATPTPTRAISIDRVPFSWEDRSRLERHPLAAEELLQFSSRYRPSLKSQAALAQPCGPTSGSKDHGGCRWEASRPPSLVILSFLDASTSAALASTCREAAVNLARAPFLVHLDRLARKQRAEVLNSHAIVDPDEAEAVAAAFDGASRQVRVLQSKDRDADGLPSPVLLRAVSTSWASSLGAVGVAAAVLQLQTPNPVGVRPRVEPTPLYCVVLGAAMDARHFWTAGEGQQGIAAALLGACEKRKAALRVPIWVDIIRVALRETLWRTGMFDPSTLPDLLHSLSSRLCRWATKQSLSEDEVAQLCSLYASMGPILSLIASRGVTLSVTETGDTVPVKAPIVTTRFGAIPPPTDTRVSGACRHRMRALASKALAQLAQASRLALSVTPPRELLTSGGMTSQAWLRRVTEVFLPAEPTDRTGKASRMAPSRADAVSSWRDSPSVSARAQKRPQTADQRCEGDRDSPSVSARAQKRPQTADQRCEGGRDRRVMAGGDHRVMAGGAKSVMSWRTAPPRGTDTFGIASSASALSIDDSLLEQWEKQFL
jgi:hypothetical protein